MPIQREEGHAPDRPYNAPSEALRAAKTIYELIPRAFGKMLSWEDIEPELKRAFDDSEHGNIVARINNLRRLIGIQFNNEEEVQYNKIKFSNKRRAYEAAVLRKK
jgi:hypothetical protein